MANLDPVAIGGRIALARKQAGLTQGELAERIGVIPRSVQNYEAGRIPWKLLDSIAEATGVTKEWILHGDALDDEIGDNGEGLADVLALLRSIERKVDGIAKALDK